MTYYATTCSTTSISVFPYNIIYLILQLYGKYSQYPGKVYNKVRYHYNISHTSTTVVTSQYVLISLVFIISNIFLYSNIHILIYNINYITLIGTAITFYQSSNPYTTLECIFLEVHLAPASSQSKKLARYHLCDYWSLWKARRDRNPSGAIYFTSKTTSRLSNNRQ